MPITIDSPTLLSNLEMCPRRAFWSPWRRAKISTAETLKQTLYRCLTLQETPEATFGDEAGSTVLELASSPGIETEYPDKYTCAIHHACLADVLVTTLRKKDDHSWLKPDPAKGWVSGCLMSPAGDHLRRVVLVSNWNADRHYSECRSWYTVGEMAHYGMPMDLVVLVIGQERNGKRKSHWTSALRHTIGKTNIRFRRRVGNTSGGFKDSWTEIWREDHDEISRETWLNAMLKDDVLRDLIIKIEMPALTTSQAQMFRDLAARKLEQVEKMKAKPPLQLTGCDWPVKCQFLKCCHSIPEKEPSEKMGFVRIDLGGNL